ncbi:hypothetical protein [Aquiflexum balticum]|uniref:hypothetical protein n=1 Tax=Aquiflexum balticum TaxID=280473 RepID=UPI000A009C88|nr:hypothetical protein [Aquiflexum balticum]
MEIANPEYLGLPDVGKFGITNPKKQRKFGNSWTQRREATSFGQQLTLGVVGIANPDYLGSGLQIPNSKVSNGREGYKSKT